ncbi:TPA: TIGR03747 family integrating conjugative element membrane protein [Escherichia coli]|nr:TIGR03747 family integrating conjugative element membrane protein [Escherichia coli]
MAEPRREVNRAAQPSPPRQHGLLWNLLWGWPWMLVGILFSSLLLSLLVEYIGIAFFWPEQGAAHSEAVMKTELGWLSSEFTRSLLLSAPSVTVTEWIATAYQWLFVETGFLSWLKQQNAGAVVGNSVSQYGEDVGRWLSHYLYEYLMATVYVTVVTLIRVTILVLSVPLFVMVILIAVVEGLGRRDLRRYGAAYESSFVYHHAKKSIKPAIYIPCILYLSWPTSVYPNLLIWPAAMLLGVAITVTMASFKKYL